MLVKAAKKEIEQYMDFAYSLAMDQTKSGYPLWSDGISMIFFNDDEESQSAALELGFTCVGEYVLYIKSAS